MRTLPLTIALLVTTLPAVAAPRSAEAGTAICSKSLVTITGAGRIEGTPGNDVIQGSHGRDVIGGNGDSDQVYGGGDNDALAGGAANFDDCHGEEGADNLLVTLSAPHGCETTVSIP